MNKRDIHTTINTGRLRPGGWLFLLQWLRLLVLSLARINHYKPHKAVYKSIQSPENHILAENSTKTQTLTATKLTNMNRAHKYLKWSVLLLFAFMAKFATAQTGPFQFTGNDDVCIGQTKNYGVAQVSGSTYAWTISPGTEGVDWNLTVNGNTITVKWLKAGTYTISVVETNADNCSGDAVQITVTVHELPLCSITGPDNICPGSTNAYTGASAPSGSYTYNWSITGDATISGASNTQTVSIVADNKCGSYTLTLVTTNEFGCSSTCTQTYNITAPPVVLNPPKDTVVSSCLTQAQVDAAFADWLARLTSSGGCTLVVTNNAPAAAPAACGGSVTVIWTATSACDTTTTTATFTVADAPALVLTPAQPRNEAACQTQAQIDAAYAQWLASVTATGGCNTAVTNNAPAAAPAACGGSVTVIWTATSACDTTTTTATFTVADAPALVLTPAQPRNEAACQTQAQIDAAYAQWLASVTATGGCNTAVTNNAPAAAPAACGGSVTVIWTATSACDTTTTTATFTVADAPALVLTPAQPRNEAACQTQAQIDAAYAQWLASVTATGGCNTAVTNNAPAAAPAACGGSVTVIWTATSACDTTTTTATFTVADAPALVLTPAQPRNEAACQTQAQIDAAYAQWLASVTATGGCNTAVTNNAPAAAPAACGGSVTVIWTATSACDTTTTTATFTVADAPALVLTPAQPRNEAACQTQAQIDAAYAQWLASVTATGGCNTAVTNNAPAAAPAACGGSVTVIWTATSACDTTTTTATFTVADAPALVLTPAQPRNEAACQTQAQIDAAYAQWLASVTATGGCNTAVTNNAPAAAPAACGGSVTVIWTATSACDTTTTTATFTVADAPALVLTPAQPRNEAACQTQAQIDAAYAQWLASVTATGGCNTAVTNNAPAAAPAACGGSVTVIWTATSACDTTTTTATFTVADAPALVLTPAQPRNEAACQTQAQIDAAYAQWLASVTATGGCNTAVTNNAPAAAPAACGGSVTVIWTATSACDTTTTTATFTVADAPALVLTPAQPRNEAACQTQAQIDAAYAQWLASVTATGGCNTAVTNNAPAAAPAACGGSVTVIWTATSACDTTTTTATFTVADAPALVLTPAQPRNEAACQTQAQIDAAYAQWLASVTATGGCNTAVTNNAPAAAPAACGGSVTVIWTATSACDTTTTTATFTVADAPALVLTPAQPRNEAACQTQAQIDAAYAQWLASVTATGGCNTAVTNNAPAAAPAACGGSVTVIWTATSACDTTTTTATFTVADAPALVLTPAQPRNEAACQTQAQIDAAYAQWLASVTATGGCNTAVTNNAPAAAPAACGGSVTVIWTATSACDTTTTTATFTVADAPALVLTPAQPRNEAACQTQAQIDAAYAQWLASVTATGGCNTAVTNNAPAAAPAACGGSVTVIWTATSACDTTTTTATFTVADAPALVLTPAQPRNEAACQTQAQIDAAYAQWLASVTATGGCNTAVTNNAPAAAPAACGGSVTVIWTATSACDTTTTTATFTVADAPALVLTPAQPRNEAACQTQAQIDAAYAQWLASVTATGGCNTAVTNNAPAAAPAACGGSVTVIWTATSACDTTTTTATFTVADAPALVLTPAQPRNEAACQTQAQIDAAYAQWLASVTATGGCNTAVTNNAPAAAPAACGGSVTVIWTATSACDTTTTTATFTVADAPALVLTPAQPRNEAACQTQAQIDAAYAQWLASVTATGGCNTAVTNNAPAAAPAACGGSVTVIWTATSACDTTTTTATFTVADAPALVLTPAQPRNEAACQTQAQIDAAYAQWLASVTATGGCNTAVTNNAPAAAPAACGGSVTVIWTATSACDTTTTTATFTVADAPPMVLTCPPSQTFCEVTDSNYTIPALTAVDGCNRTPTISYEITGVTTRSGTGNDASGIFNVGVSIIKWTVTDACGDTSSCTTTVNINPSPVPIISGPDSTCANTGSVTYSTPQVGCNTYSWTISSGGTIIGSSTGNSITVQWTTPGTKTVTVTETMCGVGGCSKTVTKDFIVNPKPVTTPITHD